MTLGLAALIFVVLSAIGSALLGLFDAELGTARRLLLAPSAGLATLVLATMFLNQAGLPVRSFAVLMVGGLLFGSVAIHRKRPFRDRLPRRVWLAGVLLAALALVLPGWPSLFLGLHWVAYANDDMVNYCLAAEQFLNHGFFEPPKLGVIGVTEYSQFYWFFLVAGFGRFGNELYLAIVSAATGLKAVPVFMAAILALGATQVFALGALVMEAGSLALAAAAMLLLTCSPLYTLSVELQLIAQVGGIALLLATLACLTQIRRGAIPGAVIGSALAICYPEVLPFLGLTATAYLGLEGYRTRRWREHAAGIAVALATSLMLLRYNWVTAILLLRNQASIGQVAHDSGHSLFPYFLRLNGLPALIGLSGHAQDLQGSKRLLYLLLSGAAFAGAAAGALRDAVRPRAAAILFGVCTAIGILLLVKRADFGTFKLAMFFQPALMAALASLGARLPRKAALATLAAFLVLSHFPRFYIAKMTLPHFAPPFDLAAAMSKRGVTSVGPERPHEAVVSDLTHLVEIKYLAAALEGVPLTFRNRDAFGIFTTYPDNVRSLPGWVFSLYPHSDDLRHAPELAQAVRSALRKEQDVFGAQVSIARMGIDPGPKTRVEDPPELSPFNKLWLNSVPASDRFFRALPDKYIHTGLSFVDSSRGRHFYGGAWGGGEIGLFPGGVDPGLPAVHVPLFGLGRFVLLRVDGRDEPVRLRLSISSRAKDPGKLIVHGRGEIAVDLPSASSAQILTDPITPLSRDGVRYLWLDLSNATPDPTSGIRAGFRDISALTQLESDSLALPKRIAHLPDDLIAASGLEFAGVGVDGVMASEGFILLGRSDGNNRLRWKLATRSAGRLELSVNGIRTSLDLSVARSGTIPIQNPGPKTRVEFRFPDGARGARIEEVAIE